MKESISKVVAKTFKLNLIASDWYLNALQKAPELIDKIANGVGSETNWLLYHMTPDTIYLLNINASSHIHDVDGYTYPYEFKSVAEGLAHKRRADYIFYLNVTKMIENYGGWFKSARKSRLKKYMFALEAGGSEAFWVNKILPPNYDYYYDTKPVNDPELFSMYKKTWQEICAV